MGADMANHRRWIALLGALWVPAVLAQGAGLATAKVELREVELTYPTEALVEAVRQATVAAQVQGRVVEVRADAGDRVRQGEVLMRIDEREAAQAEAGADAQLAQAQANLANAKATYERTRNLLAQKFVSQAALDQAESAWRAAEAQVRAAAAGKGQAGTVKAYTMVTSPLTGIVAQRHAEQGEMASPGKELITVFEPGDLRVVANVPQYKLAEVKRTLKARVELPESGRWIDAASVTLLPTADARTHSVRVRVNLPEDVQGVAPGMYARAHFVTGKARKLVVPAQAVLRRGEVSAVYAVDEKGRLQMRQVRLGEAVAGDAVEVLAGLTAGESVALDPVKAGMQLVQLNAKQ
jgi:RND family efflux transporter MFP subunit